MFQLFWVECSDNCGIDFVNLFNKVVQFVDERFDVYQVFKVQYVQIVEVDWVSDFVYCQVLNVWCFIVQQCYDVVSVMLVFQCLQVVCYCNQVYFWWQFYCWVILVVVGENF